MQQQKILLAKLSLTRLLVPQRVAWIAPRGFFDRRCWITISSCKKSFSSASSTCHLFLKLDLIQEWWVAEHRIASMLTHFGVLSASPAAFLIVLVYAALWLVFKRDTFDWHAVATLATWLMTLVIQRSEHRDTQAMHAKLDELLRAIEGAQTSLSKIDEEEPEDIETYREKAKDGG
jgi:low affinity Fe/Cu permease